MTNLIASLIITVSINWSGAGPENKEVGFIQTNYSAQCVFEGKTNLFTLENRFADVVAWREKQISPIHIRTNTAAIIEWRDQYQYNWPTGHIWMQR